MPDHNRNSRFTSNDRCELAVDVAAAQLLAALLGRIRDPDRRRVLGEALDWIRLATLEPWSPRLSALLDLAGSGDELDDRVELAR